MLIEVLDVCGEVGKRVDVILVFPPVELIDPIVFGIDKPFVSHTIPPAVQSAVLKGAWADGRELNQLLEIFQRFPIDMRCEGFDVELER